MNMKGLRSTAMTLPKSFGTVPISQDSGFEILFIESSNIYRKHYAPGLYLKESSDHVAMLTLGLVIWGWWWKCLRKPVAERFHEGPHLLLQSSSPFCSSNSRHFWSYWKSNQWNVDWRLSALELNGGSWQPQRFSWQFLPLRVSQSGRVPNLLSLYGNSATEETVYVT